MELTLKSVRSVCYRVLRASFVRAVLVPCDQHSPALNTLAFVSVYISYLLHCTSNMAVIG